MTIQRNLGHLENEDASVKISTQTAGWEFRRTDGLQIQVVESNEALSNGGKKQLVSIYGTPDGLNQLADLFRMLALLNQKEVSDRNCPPNEGVHVTLETGVDLAEGTHDSIVELNVGRLDAKADGSTDWFSNP